MASMTPMASSGPTTKDHPPTMVLLNTLNTKASTTTSTDAGAAEGGLSRG